VVEKDRRANWLIDGKKNNNITLTEGETYWFDITIS
jgi:hypothetical protein